MMRKRKCFTRLNIGCFLFFPGKRVYILYRLNMSFPTIRWVVGYPVSLQMLNSHTHFVYFMEYICCFIELETKNLALFISFL